MFYKYHGSGNDFVIIDAMQGEPLLSPLEIAALCRRNTGIGADGVIFTCEAAAGIDAAMRIFNADGSEAEMCGNGIRCLAKYLFEKKGLSKENQLIETLAGVKKLQLIVVDDEVEEVEVDMGMPEFSGDDLPAINDTSDSGEVSIVMEDGKELAAVCLSMGNPHCVLFIEDVDEAPVSLLGRTLEMHHIFPNRTNVEFAQLTGPNHLLLRVWERGVGETAACGTGACAAFAAAIHTGQGESPMTVKLRGGDLKLRLDQHGHIHMTGPAVQVFQGELNRNWRV
jgi:diaminopimelate epimerase